MTSQKAQPLPPENRNKFQPDEIAPKFKSKIQPVPKDDRPEEKGDEANIRENTSNRRQS